MREARSILIKAVSAYGGTQLKDRLCKDVACVLVVQGTKQNADLKGLINI